MLTPYGCSEQLSQKVEAKLAKMHPQTFLDHVQRLAFYFSINAQHLNTLSAAELVCMPDEQLIAHSDAARRLDIERAKRQLYDEIQQKDLSEGKFVCRCGGALKCSLENRRSADEGAIVVVTCMNPKCGASWKW